MPPRRIIGRERSRALKLALNIPLSTKVDLVQLNGRLVSNFKRAIRKNDPSLTPERVIILAEREAEAAIRYYARTKFSRLS